MLYLLSQLEALLASALCKKYILYLILQLLKLVRNAERVHLHLLLMLTPYLSMLLISSILLHRLNL